MHELSIIQSVIKISCEEAEKHKVEKIKEIRLKVGEFSGLMPSCIQYYFDIASKGTKAQGAVLNIEKIPVTFKCNECGFKGEREKNKYTCPSCGGYNLQILGGNEFYIESLGVE